MPIEPPRIRQDGEVYARRQHQFVHPPAFPDRKGSLLGSLMKDKEKMGSSASPNSGPLPPARFSIDARLPNPAVLTCGHDLPIKILVKQLNERSEELYLQTLQIELIGFTKVRAHEATRTETNSWVIISLSNLNQTIGAFNDPAETETELTKELWYGHKLPDTVAPSFVTCNISRSYELQVSAGLSYGPRGGAVSLSNLISEAFTNQHAAPTKHRPATSDCLSSIFRYRPSTRSGQAHGFCPCPTKYSNTGPWSWPIWFKTSQLLDATRVEQYTTTSSSAIRGSTTKLRRCCCSRSTTD